MALSKQKRNLFVGLAFLTPNILGVMTFVIIPVLFAIVLAFTNWDLRKHNMFENNPLEFVGLSNFLRLFSEANFLKYVGNTLFMMMGIPFGISAALGSATLLSKDTRGGGGRVYGYLVATAVLVASMLLLAAAGLSNGGMLLLFAALAGGILIAGMLGGVTIYRTLFYTPHFTAGVATFILWKKLYSPTNGPINQALTPVLDEVGNVAGAAPWLESLGHWVGFTLMALLVIWGARRLFLMWRDGDVGQIAIFFPIVLISIPIVISQTWGQTQANVPSVLFVVAAILTGAYFFARSFGGPDFRSQPMAGVGGAIVFGGLIMVCLFVTMGLSTAVSNLPAMSLDDGGLQPPDWLNDYAWAKPSLMIMGFWGAVGSNTMLLYLAALTNIPGELYEAADIDGASRFQKFWNVTWPQLAPTTFFVAVMATIGGLQGGFESARVMTQGGPAGATTTISYFIYQEGFETGRLSFSAGAAWVLFLLVFSVTMFNWKFGNRYVND